MPDPGPDLLVGIGGAIVGGLGTWAAVAGKFGRLEERVSGVIARQDGVDKRLDGIEKKLDRVLDAVGAGRRAAREDRFDEAVE